jgi:hypothetical protein
MKYSFCGGRGINHYTQAENEFIPSSACETVRAQADHVNKKKYTVMYIRCVKNLKWQRANNYCVIP